MSETEMGESYGLHTALEACRKLHKNADGIDSHIGDGYRLGVESCVRIIELLENHARTHADALAEVNKIFAEASNG